MQYIDRYQRTRRPTEPFDPGLSTSARAWTGADGSAPLSAAHVAPNWRDAVEVAEFNPS
jgi:hypothetical protein